LQEEICYIQNVVNLFFPILISHYGELLIPVAVGVGLRPSVAGIVGSDPSGVWMSVSCECSGKKAEISEPFQPFFQDKGIPRKSVEVAGCAVFMIGTDI
jgi:hypothetical protein